MAVLDPKTCRFMKRSVMPAKSLLQVHNMLLSKSIKKDRENDYLCYTDIPAKTAPTMLNNIPFLTGK